ncbi:cob(I)yrinic acid a,c-diamide adenosyltransferase [Porphyromonas pogonae]|uniref:cob(I)yrinic acid a,c-diamide adenosyltransferase n=1 Tax=Porphyromonas pogonae TaxID=867595 RepID=UPI002E767A60|nr:cob(I)yrinic acid a,c-diamide adenosyltransferase [Porphyromonas pogonae]
MGRIYTKTGDKGKTSIFGGERVEKDDNRVEAYGTLDELNAALGVVRSLVSDKHIFYSKLYLIQMHMMPTMSIVATPDVRRSENQNIFDKEWVTDLENDIDQLLSQTKDNGFFILPGGTVVSAQLQWARTVARRAERRLWSLNRIDPVPEDILKWINRISDLLFVMAKYEMQSQNWPEEKWKEFAYKRKKK